MTKVSEWCGQRGAEGEHCHGRLRPPQAVWRDLCAFPRLPGMSAQGWLRNRCSQTNGRAQQTASNPSGKSALRAAPRFYQINHRDGIAVAITTRLCFVSRVAAGVTAISEAASYPCPQQNRRIPRQGVLQSGVGNSQPPARVSVQASGIETQRVETKARSLAMKARPA